MSHPSVSVGIPTRDRPQEVRRAIESIRAQTYAGDVEIVVVFDGTEPDTSLESSHGVRVLRNERSAGLAGARNTAILATDADFVAFCDDDDVWLPGKLAAQLARDQDAVLRTCSITVDHRGKLRHRAAGCDLVTNAKIVRSRMAMLHASTFVFRRDAMLGSFGLVDESIPGAQGEDLDMLLRASAKEPIPHVDAPLVRVVWGASSYFSRRWDTRVAGIEWMLEHHPEIAADNVGASRSLSQLAFAEACRGQSKRARSLARQALARNKRQWRAPLALAVSTGLVDGETVLGALNRRGRGV